MNCCQLKLGFLKKLEKKREVARFSSHYFVSFEKLQKAAFVEIPNENDVIFEPLALLSIKLISTFVFL
jgi:hypothetical protein